MKLNLKLIRCCPSSQFASENLRRLWGDYGVLQSRRYRCTEELWWNECTLRIRKAPTSEKLYRYRFETLFLIRLHSKERVECLDLFDILELVDCIDERLRICERCNCSTFENSLHLHFHPIQPSCYIINAVCAGKDTYSRSYSNRKVLT
ncbi:uncharacterized protein LOC113335944 [Papaver somniferum]|uniref:uncharacterized protein LOC113335944 n=1 Tax=Papaver somniferum TaxID=3469 RepID=UPI000E6F8A81|nr:uncharacterized protein LOC113335944 [Papaver somniferum]